MEEFTLRLARALHLQGGLNRQLGLVRFANWSRRYVAGRKIEIVSWAIEISGHGAHEVAALLTAIGLAQL
jgi:hypothetical protein